MTFEAIILKAAASAGVSGQLLLAICLHESGLRNVELPHDGGSPTYGICQIKENTAKMLGYSGTGKGLMNPETNAKWAALYLKYQNDRYEHDPCKSVSAYNAGSYMESKVLPGSPKNLQYVLNVRKNLSNRFRDLLSCNSEPDEVALETK